MSAIRVLHETEDTVTISRDDWEKLQEALEDAEDRTAVAERRAYERQRGKDIVRRDYLTGAEALRLLAGDNPLKVWRKKRALSQRALAARAGIGAGYLAEIETNRKRGSSEALRKLAAVLHIPHEELDARRYLTRDPHYGPVGLHGDPVSAKVSPGERAAWSLPMHFPTLEEALDFARDEWSTLQTRSPWITDAEELPICDADELRRIVEE